MKKLIVTSNILILILLFTMVNPKVLATSNIITYEENYETKNVQNFEDKENPVIVNDTQNIQYIQNNNANLQYGILDENEQLPKEIQELSIARPRDPKGGLIMIIITITGAIIIVLASWWYKTNY